ncbi:hypothetical protein B0H14DRAFT_2588521 [Mycena olivaceomarginata]|nr:hypothetical protein B0H14DRAFT_2588521 [Mycena olivaceomarginata]
MLGRRRRRLGGIFRPHLGRVRPSTRKDSTHGPPVLAWVTVIRPKEWWMLRNPGVHVRPVATGVCSYQTTPLFVKADGAKPENGCFDVVHGSREPIGTASGIESSTKVQGVTLIAKIPFIFGVCMYTDLEETPKKIQQSPGAALDRRIINPPPRARVGVRVWWSAEKKKKARSEPKRHEPEGGGHRTPHAAPPQ